MAVGKCGKCKYCELKKGVGSDYCWCTYNYEEVKPEDIRNCGHYEERN